MPAPLFEPPLINRLRSARRIAVLTGAGISAESGVPTFRSVGYNGVVPNAAQTGLWERYNPQDLATSQAFQSNPRLVWEWYAWRRTLIANAGPNPGHYALAEIERRAPVFTLITQNIDGLHQQAGSGLRFDVVELHGNIQRTKCFKENRPLENWPDTGDIPPRCPYCGGPLRPDVVWFGEALPIEALQAAWEAAQLCEVFFSIGTSGTVEPAASLPFMALKAGATVVEINPQTTPLTGAATYVLAGPSGEILPRLVEAVWPAPTTRRP